MPFDVHLTPELYAKGPEAYTEATCVPRFSFHGNRYRGDVNLTGLPKLTTICDYAFVYFRGILTLAGEYPLLRSIGNNAFAQRANEFNLDRRTTITESHTDVPPSRLVMIHRPRVFFSEESLCSADFRNKKPWS